MPSIVVEGATGAYYTEDVIAQDFVPILSIAGSGYRSEYLDPDYLPGAFYKIIVERK